MKKITMIIMSLLIIGLLVLSGCTETNQADNQQASSNNNNNNQMSDELQNTIKTEITNNEMFISYEGSEPIFRDSKKLDENKMQYEYSFSVDQVKHPTIIEVNVEVIVENNEITEIEFMPMEDPMLIVEEICTDACGDGTCNMECGEDSENCPLDCSE